MRPEWWRSEAAARTKSIGPWLTAARLLSWLALPAGNGGARSDDKKKGTTIDELLAN
jgi:hypothetical protein